MAQLVKDWPVNAGDARDVGSIPRSGRSPEKEMATRGAWQATIHGVTKSQT